RRHGPGRGPQAGPPSQKKNAGPKRGDGVQNSSYVSPEARKTRSFTLTPRAGEEEGKAPRTANGPPPQGPRGPRSGPPGNRGPATDRTRRDEPRALQNQKSSGAHPEKR